MNETTEEPGVPNDVPDGAGGPDEEELRLQGIAELQQFVDAHPDAQRRLLAVVARRLNGAPDAHTWQLLYRTVSQYVGERSFGLLSWVAMGDEEDRIRTIEESASPEVLALIREVVANHGIEWREAWMVWNEQPDDWRELNREVYYDRITGRTVMQLRIQKYSGEEVLLQGYADSIMNLTKGMLLTLRFAGTPDAFSPTAVDEFLVEVAQLIRVLRPEQVEAAAGNGEAAITLDADQP